MRTISTSNISTLQSSTNCFTGGGKLTGGAYRAEWLHSAIASSDAHGNLNSSSDILGGRNFSASSSFHFSNSKPFYVTGEGRGTRTLNSRHVIAKRDAKFPRSGSAMNQRNCGIKMTISGDLRGHPYTRMHACAHTYNTYTYTYAQRNSKRSALIRGSH